MVLSFILLMSYSLYLTSGAFLDFRLTTEDPNHLTLECYSSLTGDVDDEATIDFFDSPSGGADSHGNILSGGTFNVTSDNEAFLRCASGNSVSNFVAIAAVPPDYSRQIQNMNVFNDGYENLTCPIQLGNLYPYIFSWEVYQQDFVIPLNPSPSFQYSNNNRSLRVFVNGTTHSNHEYRCMLRLRRCNIFRSNGSPRCSIVTHVGPRIEFEVFERGRVTSPPIHQEIHVDEIARFVCIGVGSFITISWQYDEVCINGSCEDAVAINVDVIGDLEGRHSLISSVLLINASMLQFQSTGGEYSVSIGCILHQFVPPEYNLQGQDDQIFFARLAITKSIISLEPGGTENSLVICNGSMKLQWEYEVWEYEVENSLRGPPIQLIS